VGDVALGGFDAATARLVWNPQTGWGGGTLVQALALGSDTVFADGGTQINAFRVADASLRWQTAAFAHGLALAGGRLYGAGGVRVFAGYDDNGNPIYRNQSLYALDPATGTLLGWDRKPTARTR
jgi:outer membrane protein assembly factor BamB